VYVIHRAQKRTLRRRDFKSLGYIEEKVATLIWGKLDMKVDSIDQLLTFFKCKFGYQFYWKCQRGEILDTRLFKLTPD